MTEKLRVKIAREYRELLDGGMYRKKAMLEVCEKYGVHRTTVYRYCARFGISTS